MSRIDLFLICLIILAGSLLYIAEGNAVEYDIIGVDVGVVTTGYDGVAGSQDNAGTTDKSQSLGYAPISSPIIKLKIGEEEIYTKPLTINEDN